jgi:hypothetical protein
MAIRPQTTLDDVKRLAGQLGVTFTRNRDSFDLDKSTPLEVHGTYRTNQAGINAAFTVLVHLQEGERRLLAYRQDCERDIAQLRRSIRRDRSIGASGVLGLSLLAALIAYAIGTFAPQTRGITGPLTILCMALVVVSGCTLLFGHGQK